MHFPNALVTLATTLAVISQGSAFVIEAYKSTDCSGESQHVNVYDNTCATWMEGFSSYMPKYYGGKQQMSYFFVPGNCGSLPAAVHKKWVDGGGDDFKVNNCYNFGGEGFSINAAASYWHP